MTRPSNEPLEAEPVPPGEIPMGPPAQTPPHRASYSLGQTAGQPAPGAFHSAAPPGATPPSSPHVSPYPPLPGAQQPALPNTLNYSSRGAEMWEFWTAQWWRRRRNLMAAGLALFALGLGMTQAGWSFPPLLMAAGAFLVGLALPVREDV